MTKLEHTLKKAELYEAIDNMNGKQAKKALAMLVACSDTETIQFLDTYLDR